ncbi:MAG: hypothetical protein ABIT01_04610 [Thermoanaerobaculia bacterium]
MPSNESTPLLAGFRAMSRHRRLAGFLWFALTVSSSLTLGTLSFVNRPFDEGPFRESIMKGWDSWAILSMVAFEGRELKMLLPIFMLALIGSFMIHLFLVSGAVRTLIADVPRPVIRRTVAETAALARPTFFGFLRFVITLVFWELVLVGIPVAILGKIEGKNAVPNAPLSLAGGWWTLAVGTIVFLNVLSRFDLARIALARDDASSARGAFRVAKERLKGHRPAAVLLLLFWIVAGFAIQAAFTNLGVAMNPQTDAGVLLFILVRQIGFFMLALTWVGLWGSLLAWEKARRPVAVPFPGWRPVPAPVAAPAQVLEPEVIEPRDIEPEPEIEPPATPSVLA